MQATADLIAGDPSIAAVLALGDDQYGCGGYSAFLGSFDITWGRFLAKIHPVPGNHEYQTSGGSDCAPDAAGYFHYFGAAAGNAQGDYAWNIGAWHMIALNGECKHVGGCDAGSAQGNFLQSNLGTQRVHARLLARALLQRLGAATRATTPTSGTRSTPPAPTSS